MDSIHPNRQRETGQPSAGGLVVPPPYRDACVEARLKMVKRLLAVRVASAADILSRPDLSRQRGEELDLDQIDDRRAWVAAKRPLSQPALSFRTVVRHQKAGVDVDQYRPSRRARTTARLTRSPFTRIEALSEPRAGSRRPLRVGGTSRATSRPRRTTET
jgi:hypothetical protein